ncbi:MAG: hypothetical protein US50_C0052G0010 [Candidatus Nomurabacteria bacterium GW2011_GWB1_37_5]|uniref:Large ribosomal subunit protein uL29 n=1 Tax=Candidatus Nomurabacteria bacterium GW2011_GWB1_37_5 TaxID=1618742 RepID=A0A0G0JC31_9BACT|nr:MAG: hypothetical protein US50_C0052G0010 [Candidatus Nomurabacteria bacterium GW2011_GWB1_37_5]
MKIEDLNKELEEKRMKLKNFRFSLSGGKTKNIKEGHEIKKEIARILTAINNR